MASMYALCVTVAPSLPLSPSLIPLPLLHLPTNPDDTEIMSPHALTTPPTCNHCPCCTAYSLIIAPYHIEALPSDTIGSVTVALLMRAVYFSDGPFADVVDRVRNDSRLWPYRGARQAENKMERAREWEGMMTRYRERMRWRKEVDVETEGGNGSGSGKGEVGVELQGKTKPLEDSRGREHESHFRMRLQVPEAKEKQKVEKEGNQTQAVCTVVRRKMESAKPAEVPEVQQPAVQEPRRTALDIFEFEAPKPTRGW